MCVSFLKVQANTQTHVGKKRKKENRRIAFLKNNKGSKTRETEYLGKKKRARKSSYSCNSSALHLPVKLNCSKSIVLYRVSRINRKIICVFRTVLFSSSRVVSHSLWTTEILEVTFLDAFVLASVHSVFFTYLLPISKQRVQALISTYRYSCWWLKYEVKHVRMVLRCSIKERFPFTHSFTVTCLSSHFSRAWSERICFPNLCLL